jgi:glucosyl-dolichyl phosphate glucuronosyltransferase
MSQYLISVVVCTYNRANILKYTLQALANQTVAKNLYEVVVINNNSTDHTEEIAKEFIKKYDNYQIIQEREQGISHARNRGIKEAKADYIAYLDDDVRPLENYVERMIWIINNYDFDVFGGRYVPWYLYGKPRWFNDEYACTGHDFEEVRELKAGFLVGGVMVFKKKALEAFEGFSTDMGPKAERFSYGEDTNLQVRMRKKGLKIGFDPDLVVGHLVAQYKVSIFWFFKSSYINGRDAWNTFEIKPSLSKIYKGFISIWYYLGKNILNCTPKLIRNDYYIQNWCIEVIIPFLYQMGSILSAIKIMAHPGNHL